MPMNPCVPLPDSPLPPHTPIFPQTLTSAVVPGLSPPSPPSPPVPPCPPDSPPVQHRGQIPAPLQSRGSHRPYIARGAGGAERRVLREERSERSAGER